MFPPTCWYACSPSRSSLSELPVHNAVHRSVDAVGSAQDELAAELDEELENVDSNGVDANVVGGSSSSDRQ
jgi:hypothetical protein